MSKKLAKKRGIDQTLSPSEYMRVRRPELFSDSKEDQKPRLSREVFEYHLDTLTKRKEETKFEYFARKLAEKEICPNLLPQTGPTGGGDSKVDTETYPVSESIALLWYVGIDPRAAQERWAFAISAKEDWRPKLHSDVKKIIETDRDYKRIFFITNQFVPDKKRAQEEDALSKAHGVPVRILDRSWIVEKVFGNDRLQLAMEALGLSEHNKEVRVVTGPNDARRTEEIRELDAQIEDPRRYLGVEYQLAADCLQAALLARGLERPRAEIEGRFARAARVAANVGNVRQILRIAYAQAWTAFWWFEDCGELNRLYNEVETYAKDSEQIDDLELLSNLWRLLYQAVVRKQLDPERSKCRERTHTLKAALDRLASNAERPTNALRARTDRLLIDITEALPQPARIQTSLENLKDVVSSSRGLVNYPLEQLYDVVSELGNVLPNNETYDELFDLLTEQVEQRRGEGEAGRAFLNRGFQKLRANLHYDAIRFFGRAQEKLAKREYRNRLVAALVGCSEAYEDAGLVWAARASVLSAASFALNEFWERGEIVRPAFHAAAKLVWLELQLGRVPDVLAWLELADALMLHLEASDGPDDDIREHRQMQDMVFALLLLSADLTQLTKLDFLPQVLERLDLPASQMALLFALGYEQRLIDDGWIPQGQTIEDLRKMFEKTSDQPAKKDLPDKPELMFGPRVTLRSRVLGCEISAESPNELLSIQLAEAVLSAVEAFLATSLNAGIFPYRETLTLSVAQATEALDVPRYEVRDEGSPDIKIYHAVPVYVSTVEGQRRFSEWMQELVLRIVFQIATIRDPHEYMDRVAGVERAIGRAINNAYVGVFIGNILGDNPKLRLMDWGREFAGERFPLIRSTPWLTEKAKNESAKQPTAPAKFGAGEPPEDLLDFERKTHRDIKILSLIDIPAWDKAGWRATVFARFAEPGAPPTLALGFKDKEAGARIFQGWRDRLGKVDTKEELRICIVTGIDKRNPAAYRVIVGSKMPDEAPNLFVMASRINTMQPRDKRNLETFLADYSRGHRYLIAPAYVKNEAEFPEILMDLLIGKTELIVRPMWEIGENDPDIISIQPEDDPIVPDEVKDVPIYRALERAKKKRRDDNGNS